MLKISFIAISAMAVFCLLAPNSNAVLVNFTEIHQRMGWQAWDPEGSTDEFVDIDEAWIHFSEPHEDPSGETWTNTGSVAYHSSGVNSPLQENPIIHVSSQGDLWTEFASAKCKSLFWLFFEVYEPARWTLTATSQNDSAGLLGSGRISLSPGPDRALSGSGAISYAGCGTLEPGVPYELYIYAECSAFSGWPAGTTDWAHHSIDLNFSITAIPEPGDVDGNGVVNGLDLTAVITAWMTVPGDPLWNPDADFDCNGIIDGLDLTEVISHWTTETAAAEPPVASEPTETEAVKPGRSGSRAGNVGHSFGNVRRK
jgi:hypothetical protein